MKHQNHYDRQKLLQSRPNSLDLTVRARDMRNRSMATGLKVMLASLARGTSRLLTHARPAPGEVPMRGAGILPGGVANEPFGQRQ
jgi:hypothetical protein